MKRMCPVRHVGLKSLLISLFGAILFSAPFMSCKSTPNGSAFDEVDPLALLQDDSSIYVRVPVKSHEKLVADILVSELPFLSDSDAGKLVKQLDVLYAGLGTVQDRSRLEISASGDFPSVARNFVFTKKNGWNKKFYTARSNEEALLMGYPNVFEELSSSASAFSLSFPSDKSLLLGQDISPLLDKYALRPSVPQTDYAEKICSSGEDIGFYIGRPGQYLRKLIGSTITVTCESIDGTLKLLPPDKKGDLRYELEFYVRLNKNQGKMMTLLHSMVSLAMLQMDGYAVVEDPLTLKVSGISVSEREIIDLFTMDPITGKHFRVEGDYILTY